MSNKIKVLVIDDSALIRRLLTDILNQHKEIKVVGAAEDALVARQMIKQLNPDVITLDIEMPRMDGLAFLEKLMCLRPMPVVMISTLTEKGAQATMRALELGAVDFLHKPKQDVETTLQEYFYDLTRKIKIASQSKVACLADRHQSVSPKASQLNKVASLGCKTKIKMIVIGSSTGGTEAVSDILSIMPTDMPPILITQHIPPKFSRAFAQRLNRNYALSVHEAEDGQEIKQGHVYVAPGGYHLKIKNIKDQYFCHIYKGQRVNRHCPSVEVMFKSVLDNIGSKIISVMLTGMGKDGATAMQEIRNAGGRTIAQDEASSVVWGMPGSAVKLGCVEKVVALNDISKQIIAMCQEDAYMSIGSLAKKATI